MPENRYKRTEELYRVIARSGRLEVLNYIGGGYLFKSSMDDGTRQNKRTVSRALKELCENGLLAQPNPREYVVTDLGRLILKQANMIENQWRINKNT